MKFQPLDIIPFYANPLTGEQVSAAGRFAQTVEAAVRAEELGYDAVNVGERHAGRFLSSSPTVVLGGHRCPHLARAAELRGHGALGARPGERR